MSKDQTPQSERRLDEIRLGIPCAICGVMHTIKQHERSDGRAGIRCQGHRSSQVKVQCNAVAVRGTSLCSRHSGVGRAAQKAKGQAIMLEALDSAMAELVRLATGASKDADKLRAIENLLDRNGYPRKTQYALEDARAVLSTRLDEVLDEDDLGELEAQVVDDDDGT